MKAFFALTDVGLRRPNNEDSVHLDPERGFAIVADGMGGHSAGEVASKLAVEAIADGLARRPGFWFFARRQRERAALIEAIHRANRRVYTESERDSSQRGMGTTVVALWLGAGGAHVAHVGDSRLYRWRSGELERLTQDHTVSAPSGALRNVLTRAVGVEAAVDVDYRHVDVRGGDVFLLCSDGLSSVVEEAVIVAALGENGGPEATARRLVKRAHERGAPDNVTVALVYC